MYNCNAILFQAARQDRANFGSASTTPEVTREPGSHLGKTWSWGPKDRSEHLEWAHKGRRYRSHFGVESNFNPEVRSKDHWPVWYRTSYPAFLSLRMAGLSIPALKYALSADSKTTAILCWLIFFSWAGSDAKWYARYLPPSNIEHISSRWNSQGGNHVSEAERVQENSQPEKVWQRLEGDGHTGSAKVSVRLRPRRRDPSLQMARWQALWW